MNATLGVQRSVAAPEVVLITPAGRRSQSLLKPRIVIGRRSDCDLVINDARVSREHAELIEEVDGWYIADLGSKLGTLLNKQAITRAKLRAGDRIEIATGSGVTIVFDPGSASVSGASGEMLSRIARSAVQGNDIERLSWFLQAARLLSSHSALEDIFTTLLDSTLRLTSAERGYVYLRGSAGQLTLAAGQRSDGLALRDDSTISRSIVDDAAHSAEEFIVTDTTRATGFMERGSIVANELRSVICIPLRSRARLASDPADAVLGVLYLDSHFASGSLSQVSSEMLNTIAREAAALVENAMLAKAEERSRAYEREIALAAEIQRHIMPKVLPVLDNAGVFGATIACREVGGDFLDVIRTEHGAGIVVADISGKGLSAAILASVLQGLVYTQILSGASVERIAESTNTFLCDRLEGQKYATMMIGFLDPAGRFTFASCGHPSPILIRNGSASLIEAGGNVPLGLLPGSAYVSATLQLAPRDRLLFYSDGITEAENEDGDFFGDDRLLELACTRTWQEILDTVQEHCDRRLSDDCTLLELQLTPRSVP